MLKNFSDESFDIIIQAGQSNSDGTGYGNAENPFVPNDDVWYLNSNFTITQACELAEGNLIRSNFSLSFARKYIKNGLLKNGRKLLIIRAAVGGTGFRDKRWGLSDDLFLNMMSMIHTALDLNDKNKLVAMLWHQGETDANLLAEYDEHRSNLQNLLQAVRSEFNCPNLPFIAGDFVQQWNEENPQIVKPVIKAIKDVCSNNSKCEFVNTEGLLSNDQTLKNGDTIHFSRESLYILGERYFEKFKTLTE